MVFRQCLEHTVADYLPILGGVKIFSDRSAFPNKFAPRAGSRIGRSAKIYEISGTTDPEFKPGFPRAVIVKGYFLTWLG